MGLENLSQLFGYYATKTTTGEMHTTTLLHITAVKLEVVLPPHPSSDLVLNTLKAGEDTMARVKSSQYDGLEHQGNIQHSHWSSSYNTALSLVESCWCCYASSLMP